MHTPFLLGGVERPTSYQIFKKGRLDRISVLRGGLLEKSGLTFFRGELVVFFIKNKLKSEIVTDKKLY